MSDLSVMSDLSTPEGRAHLIRALRALVPGQDFVLVFGADAGRGSAALLVASNLCSTQEVTSMLQRVAFADHEVLYKDNER